MSNSCSTLPATMADKDGYEEPAGDDEKDDESTETWQRAEWWDEATAHQENAAYEASKSQATKDFEDFVAAVKQDPILECCLPAEAGAQEACLMWMKDNSVSSGDEFIYMHFLHELPAHVASCHIQATKMHTDREEARERIRRRALATLGPSASHHEQVTAWASASKNAESGPLWSSIKARRLEVSSSLGSRRSEAASARKKALARALWQIVVDFPMHTEKTGKVESCPPSIREAYVSQIQNRIASLSTGALSQALNAWKRWCTFCSLTLTNVPPLPATEATIAVFLELVGAGKDDTATSGKRKRKGGGGAARAVRAGLATIQDHLEIELHVRDVEVRTAGQHHPTKGKGQAQVTSPSDLLNIGTLCASENKVAALVAAGIVIITRGGVRYAHAQRSKLIECTPQGALFECSEGKSRHEGKPAPPFQWWVPEVTSDTGPFPKGCVAQFCSVMRKLGLKSDIDFILPKLDPPGKGVLGASKVVREPMSLAAFNRTLFQITGLRDKDMIQNSRPTLTSYSLRRLAPTLANTCGLLLHERLPFGNWRGEGLDKVEADAARKAALPLLYADGASKLDMQKAVKTAVWQIVDRLVSKELEAGKSQWTDLASSFRTQLAMHRNTGYNDKEVPLPQEAPEYPEHSSTKSSSSTSSSNSSSSDLPEEAFEWAEWAHGSNKTDKIHFLRNGSLPGCAMKVFVSDENFGVGVDSLKQRNRPVCATCAKRLGTTPDHFETPP